MSHHRYPRHRRIAKLIHTEMAPALHRHVHEHPELELNSSDITFCQVKVTPDLSFARLYVSLKSKGDEQKKQLRRLNAILPALRYQLGQVATLKYLPKMRFELEVNAEQVSRLSQLLESIQ